MKNKFLLMMMLCFAFFGVARAQVTIGDLETATNNSYLPMNSLYEYSYSQQIYTADEIGTNGTITSITMWLNGNENLYEMPFDIYMLEVEKEEFESNLDWVTVSSSDIVYSGSVTVHNTDTVPFTFDLNAPFTYSGTGNLLIAFDNNTGQWKGGLNGMVFTAEDGVKRAIYVRRDSNDYDPLNMSAISATSYVAQRNVIEIAITGGSVVVCEKPATLEASNVTASQATLAWTGGSGNYNLEYKAAGDADWTPVLTNSTATTHTLSGLDMLTTYQARVQSVCGSDVSGWKTASFTTLETCPDGMICLGSGQTTNSYLPTYIYYKNSLTQQIYTADEIGAATAILSIDFYCTQDNTYARDFDIYMVSTEKSAFESSTDWITVTEGDLAYSGSVTLTQGWNTFELDNPFVFDGVKNVALIIDASSSNYQQGPGFFVYDAPGQAIYIYSDGADYDPLDPPGGTGTGNALLNVKNRLRLGVGEPPTCLKPFGLTVSEVAARSAKVSWTPAGNETKWQLCLNDNEQSLIMATTNPYTLSNLDPETAYTVKVRAYCDAQDQSAWTNNVSFTTDVACPAPTGLTATDVTANSANIGWTSAGNSFQLQWREKYEAQPYSFEGTFDNWTTIDADGDGFDWQLASELMAGYIIPSHEGEDCVSSQSYDNDSETALTPDNYLVSPQITLGGSISFWACAQDATYAAEHFGVAISTTGNTDASAFTTLQQWTMTAKGSNAATGNYLTRNRGNREGTWYQYTVDLSDYSGQGYVAIRHFDCTDMFYLNVDEITIEQPGEGPAWNNVTNPANPYALTGLTSETTYEVRVRANCGSDGYSAWDNTTFTTLPSCLAPTNLAVGEVTKNEATLSWTNGSEDQANWRIAYSTDRTFDPDQAELFADVKSNPATLSGLNPATTYYAYVRANCGADGASSWSNMVSFTTEEACPKPTGLQASNVMPTTATISWNGNAPGYDLQYASINNGKSRATYTNDFESGVLGDWTSIDADGDGSGWFAWTSSEMVVGHNESSYVATSASYAGVALTPDNYLVSPQVALGGTLTFYACAQDASWPAEHFGVAVSTTGNTDAADFTTIQEWTMTSKGVGTPTSVTRSGNRDLGTWYEYTVDLSSYSGQGYVAIRHFDCTDMFRLNVDDITLVESLGNLDDYDWVSVSGVTSPYELTDLEPETEYVVQVRSNCGDEGVSDWVTVTFVTPGICDPITNFQLGEVTPTTAALSWNGVQEMYSIRYRTPGSSEPAPGGLLWDFDDSSMGDWTTIDADGDGYDWVLGSACGGIYLVEGGSLAGYGHESSADFVTSGSYSNVSGALNPDNYLVSPQITLGSTLSFWACAQDATYAAEHFGVAVSTTGNTDAADFTMVAEWNMTAKGVGAKLNPGMTRSGNRAQGTWYQFSVDLSAYSGQGYVAIRHFNCTDMFLLDVDDITYGEMITVPAGEWLNTEAEGSPFVLEGLDPSTTYEVQVQGVCSKTETTEWTDLITFTTLSDCVMSFSIDDYELASDHLTLYWTGYQDTYNIQWRTAEIWDEIYFSTFDDIDDWTLENCNASSGVNNSLLSDGTGVFQFHWTTTPPQYLISPELEGDTEGAELSFYYTRSSNSYSESFMVGYSTTTNDTTAFTWSEEVIDDGTAGSLKYYTQVLPANVKYIAIKCTSYDAYYLYVTYVEIAKQLAEAGEWQTASNVTSPYTMGGLQPETTYEFQVQGNCSAGVTEWTGLYEFTTPAASEEEGDQSITLTSGWGWFSSYIELGEDALVTIEEAIAANNTTAMIKSTGPFVSLEQGVWSGQLNTLENEQMYLILTENEATEISLTGELANPENHPITLGNGWNWIGFISPVSMTIEEALSSIEPNENDMLKGMNGFSTYTGGNWIGGLRSLIPGEGYIYNNNSNSAQTLVYPTTAKGVVNDLPTITYWNANHRQFPTNLTMMVTLDASQFGMAEGSHEIGAFVNGECRGSARLQAVNGNYIAFLTVSGNNDEEVSFKLFDVVNNAEYGIATEHISYKSDDIYGTATKPMILHFRNTNVAEAGEVSLFPNPTNDKFMLQGSAIESVRVYNAMGQLLIAEECGNAEQVEINLGSFSAGVYTVSVRMANGQTSNRMVVKK